MRDCRNWRPFAVLILYFCLCVVRGSDSDLNTERSLIDLQISDLNQQTIVPDHNVATTSFENTGHSTKVSSLSKQKRCNRGRLGATLTSRQNLPSDINLIPKTLDASQIAKNLCIQCISLNKCKTAEGCKACSLLCKDVVLLKDQPKASDAPDVECANPTTTPGDGGPAVENAASSEGAREVADAEQNLTTSDGPVLGSRAGFGDEGACGGHLLATVTTGNVKDMILQMVGVEDTTDILSISVRATTRSGSAPVAKGPEGPEALLTIFKDELTKAILAENVDTGMLEPPTMHELFFRVLEMVQNSKPDVNHVGATHAEESPSQAEDESGHPLDKARHGSLESQRITNSQNERLGSSQVDPSHTEKTAAVKMPEDNVELDAHPLFREEDESFIPRDSENSRQIGHADSGQAKNLSEAHMLEGNEEALEKHSLTGKHGVHTDRISSTDSIKSSLRQTQEDEELHEEHKALLPQGEDISQQSDRLGAAHEQKSSPRQMEETDDDMLPRFPLAEKPEGFVIPQLANPAIIEGPPLPGMVLGATHKENQTPEVTNEMQNGSPNNRHMGAVDSTEEDLPRHNLADHEGSLVLQVSNISTIGLSSPIGNGVDNSFIPDMEAEASEQNFVRVTDKGQPTEGISRFEAEGTDDPTINGNTLGDNAKMEAKMTQKQAVNSLENDGTILGVIPTAESKDANKSLGEISINRIGDSTLHKGSEGTDTPKKSPESIVKAAEDESDMVGGMTSENTKPETFDVKGILINTLSRLDSTELTPLETVRAHSVSEYVDSRPNQVNLSNGMVDIDGSTIEAAERGNQGGSRLESISDNSAKNYLEMTTDGIEFQEVLPIKGIVGSVGNSNMPIDEDKLLEAQSVSTNQEEDITDTMDHEASQKMSLDVSKQNTSEGILGVKIMPDEEASALNNQHLTDDLKSPPDEIIASAAHGNDWNKLVGPVKHTEEQQIKGFTESNSPATEIQGNEMIDPNKNLNHLRTSQSSVSEIIEVATSETATDEEVTNSKNNFLGSTAENREASSEPMISSAVENITEAKNLENADLGTVSDASSIKNATGDSVLQDLGTGVQAHAPQSGAFEEVSLSTSKGISEGPSGTGTTFRVHSREMVDKSSEIGMPEGLSDAQLEEASRTMSLDTAGGPSDIIPPTETFVGSPLENRNEIPTADKPAMFSSMTTAGSEFEIKPGESTIAKQTPGTVDARPLSPIGDTLGEAPLPDLSDVEAPNSQSIAGASAADAFLMQNLTITRTEDNIMENKRTRLSSSSTSSVTADTLGDGNDMVAESSENRVMNVVVPDEFLGWSKPSDNPTTINIVIPPKAIPQESANIEKADLREEEPEDEPRDHSEFAEPETIGDDEETDNREAGGDEDFEEENQVRESDNEQSQRNTNINNRNRDFDENPEIETQLRESDNEGAQVDEEQILEDDSPNDIDREENEEEAPEVRESDTDDNDNGERGQTLKENEEEAPEVRESDTENEEGDIDTDRRTSIGIKQPQSFSRLKKLMHSMQSPQERIASAIRKAKDRSNVGAEAPSLTEEGDSTFPKKVLKTESKIGKMLEKFRDRLHKNKADVGANTVSSSAREKFAHQDANTFKNSDNSDTFDEDEIGLENERRLSKQQHSHDQDDDSRLEEPHNQEVIHTTYKSPDLKLPFRNPPRLGNGRLSSDSQLKISEDHLTVDPPRSTPSQLDRQRIFKDSQSHSQLQERMNVVNDPPLDFAPGEDPTLQEPDRELALSGINQNDLIPTTRSSIFGDHFPSTPSLSEIISSAKDKFRKTFEESTRTLDSSSRPVVGSANQRTTPGLDRILGDSTSTSGISSSNIQSPDEVRTFQQGQVLGDSNNGPVNQGLGSIDGASVRHTIQEIGQNTGRVIQETTNILGDTIRNGKQGIEKIFRGVNDLASRSNGEGLGNPDPATLRYKLPTSGITDTLGQSFNRNSIGDLDGARKAISDTSPTKSARDNIGFPRVNLNRFGQLNLDTANQDDLSGIGLTPHVTAQPIGKFNLNKFDDTGLSSPVTLQAHGRQSSEGSSGFTGLTLPAVNRIDSLGNLKPITVSEIDVKDPTNVDSLHPLGDPQSELIVEPPGLDTSDSSEEGLKVDQTGLPKQQTDSAVKQKQPVVTEGLPHIGNFDVHTPFSIPRNMMTKPTANPISNFEAAKNALLKLQQLTGRLRKKDGTGKKSSATSEEQPSVTDVVKVLQEISKEVISTAENVSKSKAKNVQSTEPNIVGSQILENSWENLQPFLPRDSHPLTIAKPPFPHKHHLVGIFPSTTLKTPLDTSSITPAFQKLLDRTSTYYTTPSAPKADTNIQMAVKPINNQFGNNEPSSTLSSALINKKIKEHQTNHLEPVQSSVTASNGLVSLPSGFANDDTIGMVQSNHQANRPIPFGLNRELPQSINDMLTPKPEAVILPPKASITPSQGSGAIDTAQLPSIGAGEPVQLPSISGDLSSSTMSSSSSDRVESRQPATKNIEDESSPVLAARHQNDIAISADTPRDIYFVGTGMKLPLQMVKKEGGEVHLSVDIDKLCSCKNNSSCAKNQSADGSELKKDLVLDGSSSSSVEKSAGDGFAKRNVPTHRSLRDVEDRYAVEWEVGDPEEVSSDVRHSADTEDTRGEHRIEIEIDDPVIIPLNSSSHTEEASNVRIVNRLSANTDEDIKTTVGSPHMTTSSNESNSNSDPDRNTIKKISDKVLSNHAVDVVMELPKATQDKKNATANIYKSEDLPKKKASPYDNTVQTNLTKLHVKKAENYQYRSPFRRLHYPELGSKKSLDSTESVPSSTEKSTYLSNLLKKLRSRLPTQEPRTVNTNLRSMSNLFSHRTRNQQVESDEGHKPTKLSNRFKDLNVDRYSNLALRNRLFPTLGRQKEPLAKLEKSADHEKEVLPVEDQDKEDQSGGIVKNVLAWFKNLNNKQKR